MSVSVYLSLLQCTAVRDCYQSKYNWDTALQFPKSYEVSDVVLKKISFLKPVQYSLIY